jgi:pimeloyl-ACP methyl ester carboxylesterase
MEQFRRLEPAGRVFVACARYMPQALPFLVRASRARMLHTGLEAFLQANFRASSADARAIADTEIVDAVIAGFTRLYGDYGRPEDAFCAELVRCQQPWPGGLGDVGCPVTLIHGERDGTAPHATALDYCAMHPRWRYVGFPDDGQLVAYVHWKEVLDVLEDEPDVWRPSSAVALAEPEG